MELEGLAQIIMSELQNHPDVSGFALFHRGSEVLSSLIGTTNRVAKHIARNMAHVGKEGDLTVKKVESSSLVLIHIAEGLVLALNGEAPEGLLISVASKISSKVKEDVEFFFSGGGKEGIELDPVAVREIPPNSVPYLLKGFSAEVLLDPEGVKILKAIDGHMDVFGISRASGVSIDKVRFVISRLIDHNIARIKTEVEPTKGKELNRIAKIVYELDERFSSTEEALKALGEADELLRLLVLNLDKKLSVREHVKEVGKAGLHYPLLSIFNALESLRSIGIAKRKGEKRGSRSFQEKRLPSTATSLLLMGKG